MKPWQFGNTSVRSGLRTRDALVALDGSGLEGRIRGAAGDVLFRELLGQEGVVVLGNDDTQSVGRKFRHALQVLGFLFPPAPPGIEQGALGPVDYITPSGRRFINAESVAAQQECFLRALSGFSLSLSGPRYRPCGPFHPLAHVLRVLCELEVQENDSRLGFFEMAAFVQTADDSEPYGELASRVTARRQARACAQNKRRFDSTTIELERQRAGMPVAASTYRDYADMNIRWLLATGLFTRRGRGLSLAPHRRELVNELLDSLIAVDDPLDYWLRQTHGTALPYDDLEQARESLIRLAGEAAARQIPVAEDSLIVETPADAATSRHDIEAAIAAADEVTFARQQADQWEEIAEYLAAMSTGRPRSSGLDEDGAVVIPAGEAPAYLEWVVWRLLLAVNRLTTTPDRTRRFAVDRDYLPIGHAPGGGPDLVAEFPDFILVVEVTLTTGDRQEAVEGTSVRRHVFGVDRDYQEQDPRPVYGLFVAPRIDPNTVAAFKTASFYVGRETHRINIVPITIQQLLELFTAMFRSRSVDNEWFLRLVENCIATRDGLLEPHSWAASIDAVVEATLSAIEAPPPG